MSTLRLAVCPFSEVTNGSWYRDIMPLDWSLLYFLNAGAQYLPWPRHILGFFRNENPGFIKHFHVLCSGFPRLWLAIVEQTKSRTWASVTLLPELMELSKRTTKAFLEYLRAWRWSLIAANSHLCCDVAGIETNWCRRRFKEPEVRPPDERII